MNTGNFGLKKDPVMMYSDIPINRYESLRAMKDEDLLKLYSVFQRQDVNTDPLSADQNNINDRIEYKDALIAIMNERHLDF